MNDWIKKEDWEYWIGEAKKEASNSTCLRMNFGSVIVKEGKELARGSNQQPYEKCEVCMREENNVPPRTQGESCHAFHSEQWAIMNALKKGENLEDAVLVVTGFNPKKGDVTYNRFSCTLCSRTIAASGLYGLVTQTLEGPKFRTAKEAYDESYKVLDEINKNKINTEEGLQKYLSK